MSCRRWDTLFRLVMVIGERRMLGHRQRVFLERIHHQSDCLLQLRIVPAGPVFGRDFNFLVGRNAVVLHIPVSRAIVKSHAWRCDSATIHKSGIIINSHQAAPRPRPHKWP